MSNKHYELEREVAPSIAALPSNRAKLLYISTARYGGDWHSMMHAHACTELFYVVGGMGQFKIGGQLLPVGVDDLVVVNPDVEHTEVSLNSSPLEYIVLGVEGLEFSPMDEDEDRYCVVNLSAGREDVLLYLRSILREIEHKAEGYETVCQNLLEVLLIRLFRRTEFSLVLTPPNLRVSKECASAHRYIDAHFKENITLDLLAGLAHVNKYYLVHTFTKEYGTSPISYLISRRIQESRYLLSETDHSLSQISHMLGFSSPSYFSQSFRKLQQMSPMEYRRSQRGAPARVPAKAVVTSGGEKHGL
ncbi:MAG: helix-turn-helix domain-containing protein [Oscillospiraceae bacterium]